MHCLIATEGPQRPDAPDPATLIIANLKKIPEYSNWYFEVCHNGKDLLTLPSTPDVIVVSRFLPGEKMETLLKHLPVIKPSSRIVLLAGRLNETSKAFINMAHSKGLTNIVTGKLPGDRPYTLPIALLQDKETVIPEITEIPDAPEILESPVDINNLSGSQNENPKNTAPATIPIEKIDKSRSLEVIWPTYMEHRDSLTGIPDRYVYEEAITLALSEAEKQKTGFGIIILKLHQITDDLLKDIMQRVRKNLRYTDFIARYDEERFILIIPNYDDVMPVAKKIAELCEDNLSYGCAYYPDSGKTASELFVQANYILEQSTVDNQYARCVTNDIKPAQGNGEKNYCCSESDHGELNNIISSIVNSQPQVKPNNMFIPAKHNERQQTSFNVQQHMMYPTHLTTGANQSIFNLNNRRKGLLCLTTSNKGGVGKTTVAITLAEALARAGVPTCIVDFDFGAPDLASFFKITKGPGIEYLAGRVPKSGYADEVIRKIKDNLYILPGPMNKTLPQFEPGQLKYLINVLLEKYPVVVGDTSPEFWTKTWYYEFFDTANMVFSVVDQSVFSEQETVTYVPRLISMGVTPEKIRIVLNKFSPKLHNAKIVEKYFCSGLKKNVPAKLHPRVVATIPEDWDAHAIGGYKGQTVGLDDAYSQWHKLAAEVAQMAGFSYDVIPGKKHKKKEDVFQKLFGRLKKK